MRSHLSSRRVQESPVESERSIFHTVNHNKITFITKSSWFCQFSFSSDDILYKKDNIKKNVKK